MKKSDQIKYIKLLLYLGLLLLFLAFLLYFVYLRNQSPEGTEDASAAVVAPTSQDPAFGSIYKEIKLKWPEDDRSWRVTNPLCTRTECVEKFIPNKVLNFTDLSYISEPYSQNAITQSDLDANLIKVDMTIDRWGGHHGNLGEKLNINKAPVSPAANAPTFYKYTIPDVPTLPSGTANQYYHHDNPVVVLDKVDLVDGNNTLQGYTGNGSSTHWMQWGWTAAVLRLYYQPNSRQHITAGIDVPTTFGENPTVKLSNINLPTGVSIEQVDYIGYYEGIDEDGDGYTTDWHESHFSPRKSLGEGSFEVYGHIGTSTSGPNFPVVWNTRYVPDQSAGGIKIFARVKGSNGIWYITQPKTGLSLTRTSSSVKIYHAQNVPEKYGSRKNTLVDLVRVRIPAGTSLTNVSEAAMFWRTWNGHNYDWGYNSFTTKFTALNHAFHQSFYTVPTSALIAGNGANDGKVWIRANTPDHAIEALWPGPALIVRTGSAWPSVGATPTASVQPSVTPSVQQTLSPSTLPTSTTLPNPSVSATAVPPSSGTPVVTPTGELVACGAADSDGNGIFTLTDFVNFARKYGSTNCNDGSVDYGPCGGKDTDRDGVIDIWDLTSFAKRYTPVESCSFN